MFPLFNFGKAEGTVLVLVHILELFAVVVLGAEVRVGGSGCILEVEWTSMRKFVARVTLAFEVARHGVLGSLGHVLAERGDPHDFGFAKGGGDARWGVHRGGAPAMPDLIYRVGSRRQLLGEAAFLAVFPDRLHFLLSLQNGFQV